MQQSLPGGWLWEDGGREKEEGKGLVMWFCVGHDCPPPDEEFVGGGYYFGPSKKRTVTATGGFKRACLMPSNDGSVDILGPDCDWLDRGSRRGPLLVRPGKGGKISKSPAGRSVVVGATSPV